MPVIVKDYTWRQTDELVVIQVPLKGVHFSKVDLFTQDNYIKASYPPFLFEVFLAASVKDEESKCILAEGEVVLELQKVLPIHWETLESDLTKDEKREIRAKNIEKSQTKAAADKKANLAKKDKLQKLAVKNQISLDTLKHDTIKEAKETEKAKAMKELEEWKQKQSGDHTRPMITSGSLIKEPNKPFNKSSWTIDLKKTKKKKSKPVLVQTHVQPKKVDEEPIMPAPRSSGTIEVSFTPRIFPTPSRESMQPEEEEWLKKQYEARKKVGFVAEDLSPEELDPVWLKEKGDTFFQAQNYLGAISAYSHAIKIGSKMPALYSNRAAAHMAIGNLHKVIEDCSKALELLTPCITLNATSRLKCHVRRAAALCRVGLAKHGVADLEVAVKLDPENSALKADLARAKEMAEKESDSSD